MGQVHGQTDHDGRRKQKILLGIEEQDGIVQDLDTCGLLYQTRDEIDEKKVDDESGPKISPIELHITLYSGFYCVLLAEVPVGCLEPALFPLHSLGLAAVRSRKRLGLLLVCRLVRLRRLIDTHELVALSLEFECMCLEAGNRGVELGKVHRVCLVCTGCVRYLTGTAHVF